MAELQIKRVKKITLMLLSVLLLLTFGIGSIWADSNDMAEESAGFAADLEQRSEESALTGISDHDTEDMADDKARILIACFSRWGNTEYPDDMDATTSASILMDDDLHGTTEYVAKLIQESIGGDLHLIQTQEPYPSDFDDLVDQNHKEMAEGYLPVLTESDLDISQYDTVFIGYPVWASDAPQAILSFLNEYDLSGKTVVPFCTHDGYGAGSSYNTIREASHAAVFLNGLAIEAAYVPAAETTVQEWLMNIDMMDSGQNNENDNTRITITIGDTVLEGILYDTALAKEIEVYFPMTVSMVGYGGREYYGGVDFYPENTEGGRRYFEDGDITYCEAHHNMAIFYAQTDNPNLSVDVIPIGKVTSDLSVFNTMGNQAEVVFSLQK